ncbi:MAG: hypothetical protein ACLQIQ_21150 [Beijerinckiaceae bacterium]
MNEKASNNPIVTRFRAVLDEVYGKGLNAVVLLGSRARQQP